MAPSATTDADIAADAVFSRITAELQKAIAFGLVIVRSRLVVVSRGLIGVRRGLVGVRDRLILIGTCLIGGEQPRQLYRAFLLPVVRPIVKSDGTIAVFFAGHTGLQMGQSAASRRVPVRTTRHAQLSTICYKSLDTLFRNDRYAKYRLLLISEGASARPRAYLKHAKPRRAVVADRHANGRSTTDRPGKLRRRPAASPTSTRRQVTDEPRDPGATRRVAAADARDAAAHTRDLAAVARDVAADLGDRRWKARHPVSLNVALQRTDAQMPPRAAKAREGAAADRRAAALARASAARERVRAAADREQAARDRALAQIDRNALLAQLASADTNRVADGWRQTFWRVFGLSESPMMLLDQDRRIVALNHALVEALGYTRERMLGLRIDSFYDPTEWELLDTHWRVFQRQGSFNGDGAMLHADGDRVRLQYAAHWAQIDGHSLALYVALHTAARPTRIKTLALQTGEYLSPRELEVLGWVALGRRAYEIAAELGIASTTVETHVRSAMRKVGARSQAQLVAIACARGLLDPGANAATT
jgi:PAS domain S-box-containing protein